MAACSLNQWDMDIVSGGPSPAVIASPLFRGVSVDGFGVITGRVEDPEGNVISGLGGFCVSIPGLDTPKVSEMTFIFRLKDSGSEIGIFLHGSAFFPPGATKATFQGRWIAFPPVRDTPAAVRDVRPGLVLPGSGDTGTSTGAGGGPQLSAA